MSRLLVVSNRLPVTFAKNESGEWSYSKSSGGLVTALNGFMASMSFTWIGSAGTRLNFMFHRDGNQG